MKLFIIFFILILTGQNCLYSQDSTKTCHYKLDSLSQTKIYFLADSEPEFPGGMEELKTFINKNLEYPSCGDFVGKVYVEFVVNENGDIGYIQIKKGLGNEIDRVVIDLIKKMPKWIPAKCQNENVSHLMILPIGFL